MDRENQYRNGSTEPWSHGTVREPRSEVEHGSTVHPSSNNSEADQDSNELGVKSSSQQHVTITTSEEDTKLDQGFSFQDSPALDLFALVLSAGTLLAIVSLLLRFDGKKQPEWKHVSLNTVIAWLSTLSKGGIIFLVSRSIGQLKWLWFAQGRRVVADFRAYDMASRGILGSSILLFKKKGR